LQSYIKSEYPNRNAGHCDDDARHHIASLFEAHFSPLRTYVSQIIITRKKHPGFVASLSIMPPKQDESAAVAEEHDNNKNQHRHDNAYGASCTSFYTKEQKRETYESLHDVLQSKCCKSTDSAKLRECILDLMEACADITEALRSTLVHVENSTNDFGDTQLSVDVSTSIVEFL
jgi:hypothetical protein